MTSTQFQRSARGGARRRGVSLLVVLCSLCLIACLAVLAIPLFFGRHDVTLDNACRLLTRDLRTLQNRAALEKIGVRLVFDEDGWRALDSAGRPVAGLGEDLPIARRFSHDGVFEGVRILEIECGPDSALSIDVRGLLTERGRMTLEFRGEQRGVEVERGGGHVTVRVPGSNLVLDAALVK